MKYKWMKEGRFEDGASEDRNWWRVGITQSGHSKISQDLAEPENN